MIKDYETEVRPTEKRILHVTIALKDYTALLEENKKLREALTEARVKINSRAINLEDNDEFVLANEYHRVLKQIDAALDTERGS